MAINKLKDKTNSKSFVNKVNEESLLIEPAEVFDIILDEKHNSYINDLSIGLIKFKRLFSDKKRSEADLHFAAPLNPLIKNYPVKHEIVLIVLAPSPESGIIDQSTTFYYTDIVNVWRNVNHNALPYSSSPITAKDKNNTDKNYSSFTGNMDTKEEIELGDYFKESIKKPDMKPFEGDGLLQGRFGTSIRFSGTHRNSGSPWSSRGDDGDPIIIIRTDKTEVDTYFDVEDINKNASSIYICDGQLIPLEPGYGEWNSFKTKPKAPTNYNDKQIIISSGRLFFNSSTENIFLSSNKSVSIAAKETINLDFGGKVVIGNQSKAQKAIKGEDLISLLDSLTFPSPMGPIPFNSAPQWLGGKQTLTDKTYIE